MRISRLVGIAALATAPALLHAQTAPSVRPFSIGVSAGASVPIGDFGDAVKTGYTVAGHVWLLPPSLPALNFRGDVSYDSWKIKSLGDVLDGNAHVLGVTANVIAKIPSSSGLHPYLIGGGGYYNENAKIGGVSGNSQSNFGLQGGVGLEFALAGFGTFVEAKFVNIFDGSSDSSSGDTSSGGSSTRYIPITFGIRF